MKRITIGCCLVFLCLAANARPLSEYRAELYRLFVERQMMQWAPILQEMQSDPDCDTREGAEEIICGYYGLVGHYLDKKKKDEASDCLLHLVPLAKSYVKRYPESMRLLALRANITGFRIALSPMKATILAVGMLSDLRSAYNKQPDDPWLKILYGNVFLYMPDMLGGDIEKSIAYYEDARKLFEQNPDEIRENWLYLQLLVTIGLSYEKSGQLEKASEMYAWLMKEYPQYTFVTETLYPRVQEKIRKNND